MNILKIENLSAGYDNKPIIKNISFELEQGKVTSLAGKNGSGKTTLMRALTASIPWIHGDVIIQDTLKQKSIKTFSKKNLAKKIARITQFENQTWPITVQEMISYGFYPNENIFENKNKDNFKRLTYCMNITGCSHLKNRIVTELSGGEWKRVMIARSLVCDPEIIILDEPLANLDPSAQVEVMALLRELADKGKTIFLSIHDLNMASAGSDTIILMNDGTIDSMGSPKEVFTQEILKRTFGTDMHIHSHPIDGTTIIRAVAPWLDIK